VSVKSFLWRWPSHRELVEKLKNLHKTRVSFIDLRTLFPGSLLSSKPYLNLVVKLKTLNKTRVGFIDLRSLPRLSTLLRTLL
jgi:hypothetical protein